MKRILVIGGYGNFGRFISQALAKEADLQIIIAGRSLEKAQQLAGEIKALNQPEAAALDAHSELDQALEKLAPDVVIHTSGPYQGQAYTVAEACIAQGCHYVDLADARDFVVNISQLDAQAKKAGVLVVSGASSVPTLSSAIMDRYGGEFKTIELASYAISTAQLTNQGLATTQAVLSYVGKAFDGYKQGKPKAVYGWQDLRLRKFWGLNYRFTGSCDIPDLSLFPARYPQLQALHFQAGIESKLQHFGLYLMSWLVRAKLVKSLQPFAPRLLKMSRWFDFLGSNNSGFFMQIDGQSQTNEPHSVRFDLLARSSDGIYIPCIPSILLAQQLACDEITQRGAQPCMGLISLQSYLQELHKLDIQWQVSNMHNEDVVKI